MSDDVKTVTELKEKIDAFLMLDIPTIKNENTGIVWFKEKKETIGYAVTPVDSEYSIADDCPTTALSYELSGYLITSEGQAWFRRHTILRTISNDNYKIIRGEYDSFGWLSGVLITPKGRVSFG
jgi:hypothetical protein